MFLIVFFILYQLTQLVFLPLLLFYFIVRFFKKKSLGKVKERLGIVPQSPKNTPVLWIHAVSVGEVLSVEHFINHYKQEYPTHVCYLTTGTIGGMRMAKKLNADYISFIPFDFLLTTYLAFKRIRPKKLIIVEAEIWPNLLMFAHAKNIPCYLLNGRINPKSAPKRRLLSFLYKLFTHIFAQSEQDIRFFNAMGIPQQQLSLLGDIKTFNVVEKKQALLAISPVKTTAPNPYTIVTAGSVHAGEADIYLNSFLNLKKEFNNFRLILVPRHFHWQQALITQLTNRHLTFTLWTETTKLPQNLHELESEILKLFNDHEILVVCKLGLLFSLYPITTIFGLGGTFVPVGGHNLLEPAVWGKPCLIGPYYHKCSAVAQPLQKAGGLISTTANTFQDNLRTLIVNPQLRTTMGKNNETFVTLQAETIKQNLHKFIKKLT